MPTIGELIELNVEPEDQEHREPVIRPISGPLAYPDNVRLSRKYEFDVFNFLWAERKALGIDTVFKFENLFIDGALLLSDGRRLAVEIKLRMNWQKACQAGWQLKQFFTKTDEAKAHNYVRAVVIFEELQGDGWHKRAQCRILPDGWNHWYMYHALIEGRRVDLFRVKDRVLEHYHAAFAVSQNHLGF